jgi:predicted nucleotidyltransferase
MDQKQAIDIVKRYKALVGERFDFECIYLFGSYARNDQHEYSDIDVAVVVQSEPNDSLECESILWRLGWEINNSIEPILIGREDDPAGFLEEIERTGIRID